MAAEDSRKKDDAEDSQKEELITGFEVGVRVFFAKYGSYLLLAAAFALLGWQIWNYFQKKHQVAVQEAWLDFEQAEQSPDDLPAKLQGVIADHDIKPVQAQAWLALGNYYVGTVALGVAPNVPGAKYDRTEQLNRAEDAYRHILDGFSDERVVAGAAHMGMGVVAEDQGNWDEARKQYEALTDSKSEFAGTAFADQASDRLAKLKEYRNAPRLAVGATPSFNPGLSGLPGATQPAGGAVPGINIPNGDSSFMLPPPAMGPGAPSGGGLSVEPPAATEPAAGGTGAPLAAPTTMPH